MHCSVFTAAVLTVFALTWKFSGACRPLLQCLFVFCAAQARSAALALVCCGAAHGAALCRPASHCSHREPPTTPAARHKHLATTERVIACWFMVTGLIHFVIEGWVVAKADFYKDASGNYLSDTCEHDWEGER